MRSVVCGIAIGVLVLGGCKDDKPRPPAVQRAPARVAPPLVEGEIYSDADLARIVAEHRSDDWYGVYAQGRKFGWAHVVMRPSEARELGAYRVLMEMHVRFSAPGREATLEAHYESFYSGTPPYRMVFQRNLETTAEGAVDRRYVCAPDGVTAIVSADGVEAPPRRLPPTQEDLRSAMIAVEIPPTAQVGQQLRYADLDEEGAGDKLSTATIDQITEEVIAGVKVPVVTVAVIKDGESQAMTSRMAGGRALELSFGGGLQLRLSDRDRATADLEYLSMSDTSVSVDRDLGDPTKLDQLHLVVGAPADFRFPSGPHQQVSARPDGQADVLLRAGPGPAVTPDEHASQLVATETIDADHPDLAALAAQLTQGARDDREKVDRIVDWVFANLKKTLSTNLSTASQVLAHREGDCTEHALLTTALARAAHIPARRVDGLMYGGDRRFYWHAWTQVELDGHWVAVDAAWNEHLADAAHLTLGTGEHSEATTTLGTITITAPR